MRITTGVDIIEVDRIKKMINEHSEDFLNKVFTDKEIEYCNNSNMHKYEKFAVRFAGKEAVYKALNVLDNDCLSFTDIEILNKENGRPYVKLYGSFKKYMDNITNIDISLSHIKETAIANVVVLWKE